MRHFLIVQGNSSPFFMALAKALVNRGHELTKINFCGGDHSFWGDWRAVDFSGKIEEFQDFLISFCQQKEITDFILHNDCRPFHRIASKVANQLGLNNWVYEEGYLRPNWLSLEKGGINGFSKLPDEPEWYLEQAKKTPECQDIEVGSGFKGRVLYDFKWQGMNYLYPRRYPHFSTHRPYPIWAEYITWGKRLSTLHWRGKQAHAITQELIDKNKKFFLFPLQLNTDSQIRIHSDFKLLEPAIDFVLESFSKNAPLETYLLIKNHPLDNAWINWRRVVKKIATKYAVLERVFFVDGGDLNLMLENCTGVVTINSTVGMTALCHQRPVALLGRAIYGISGLVSSNLSEFWKAPVPPDKVLLDAYLKVLRHAALVNGNYYTDEGVELAVKESITKMEAKTHILDDAPLPKRLQH